MALVTNASPQVVLLGTDDQSIRFVPPAEIPIPSHLPLFIDFFVKGKVGRELVDGAKLLRFYGDESFDITSKFFNPNKKFMTDIIGTGNTIMVERVIPDDVNSIANVTIYADILADKIKKYKRNTDGSIAYDSDGNPIEDDDSPIDGYRVKIIAETEVTDPDSYMGMKTQKTGTMTDSDGNSSTMYPIIELRANYLGAFYNNIGLAFDLFVNNDVDEDFLNTTKTLPYNLYMYQKDEDGNNNIIKDLFGSTKERFVFKPNVTDPQTGLSLSFVDTLHLWSNETDVNLPLVYPNFQDPYIYVDNLNTVLSKLVEAEKPYINADVTCVDGTVVNTREWFDFIDSDKLEDQYYLYNLWNAFSTKRVPYFGAIIDDDTANLSDNQKEVYISNNLPIYLGNGQDGDVSWESLEKQVQKIMDKYLDENSDVMDLAVNVENIIYDTGYSLETKKSLVNFITVRKDTFVTLATRQYADGEKVNDLVTERAIAINLKSRIQLAPESTYFGTPAARGMVVAGCGRLSNWVDRSWWPLTYDIAIKSARMMGAGDGKWNGAYLFDQGRKNIIESMYDVQPAFIPQGVKPALWSLGLVWAQPFDLKRYYFPALQTVYDNDTSVLNNYYVAMALTVIEKVAAEAHRNFTGNTSLTDAEFIEEVEAFLIDKLKDRFAGVVKVIPKVMITDYDKARGYSWTVVFTLGGNVMKTVMFSYIVAKRMEDL